MRGEFTLLPRGGDGLALLALTPPEVSGAPLILELEAESAPPRFSEVSAQTEFTSGYRCAQQTGQQGSFSWMFFHSRYQNKDIFWPDVLL